MKNIVILGQSSGVYELAKSLAQADKNIKVSIFSLDSQLPHDQSLISGYLAKKISKDQVLFAGKDFYAQNNIELILDQKLERISLRQQKITTEDKAHIKFDALVIADAPEWRFPDVKGMQKQGVYHVKTLGAADQVFQQIPFTKSIVIEVHDWQDVGVALALKSWGKETIVVVPHETRMAQILEHDVCEAILKSFEDDSWKVHYGQSIAEVLGDAEAKAVRLSSGKILAADMIIAGQMRPRLRILEDIAGDDTSVIEAGVDFQTKAGNVYAFGDLVRRSEDNVRYWNLTTADMKAQAEYLTGVICGGSNVGTQRAPAPLKVGLSFHGVSYVLDFPGWSFKILGDITPMANTMTFRSWNSETRVYQKIFTCDGKIAGAILFNLADTGVYEYLLNDRPSIAGYERYVFDPSLTQDQLKAVLTEPLKEQTEDDVDPADVSSPESHDQAAGLIPQNS